MDKSRHRTIRISEIFGPTLQGEGALIGCPTVFVRTGGCDFRCHWCDSLHAVEPTFRDQWHAMTAPIIWDQVAKLSCNQPLWVTLSGGNPATQPLGSLIEIGRRFRYKFALETQGSIAQPWFSDLDLLTLSPKPPSSGMAMRWDALADCVEAAGSQPRIVIKTVIFNDNDYLFAREVAEQYPDFEHFLQPGNPWPPRPDGAETSVDTHYLLERLDWLLRRVESDKWFSARVLPQLHVMIWGNKPGV